VHAVGVDRKNANENGDAMTDSCSAQSKTFRLEEATIDELHDAIRSGRTTCVGIVQRYIDRVRAFNGVASALVMAAGGVLEQG
jgi:amidase